MRYVVLLTFEQVSIGLVDIKQFGFIHLAGQKWVLLKDILKQTNIKSIWCFPLQSAIYQESVTLYEYAAMS